MTLFKKWLKRALDSRKAIEVPCQAEHLRRELSISNKNRDEWKGQANVDATENLALKQKLKNIRDLLGKDDEVFSKYSRSQIEDMSIEEFTKLEHLIDKDVFEGKLFLQ